MWILISIAVLLVLLLVVFLAVKRGKKHRPDYYAFFIMGICWLPLGIPLNNYALSVMGLVFMIIGLVNKDKWKTNHRSWDKLDKQEKRLRSIILVILGLLVVAGFVVFFLFEKGILPL
ncbi:hypothetical protein JXB41_01320 [Candidatus Woesearchaeota archaeon]|nr:hypothetical protein [Candidatus Woesearchaeota archaeon]